LVLTVDALSLLGFAAVEEGDVDYRLLAAFDISLGEIDADLMDLAHAQTLPVVGSRRITSVVPLWQPQ
jgi:hypothetical protein